MATKSITKSIRIKDRASARNLVNALENSHKKGKKTFVSQKESSDVKGENILRMFGK